MKIVFYFFYFFLISFHANAHDTPIAFFKIYQSEENLKLDVTFDIDDLSKVLKVSSSNLNSSIIENYLRAHTQFEFDSCFSEVKIKKLEYDNDHIKLKCEFEDKIDSYKTISINNNCLISITNHSNIIEIELTKSPKDYRMHKDRTKITVRF